MSLTPDDLAIQALYGRAYGRAHQDQVAGDESARSAADPSRRNAEPENLSQQAGYVPSRSIFGAALDQELGVKPGAAGLMPVDEDWHDYAEPAYEASSEAAEPVSEPAEPAIDPVTLDDLEPGIDRDIRAWIAANPDAVLTTQALLSGALHLVGETTRGDEMELAASMGRLGYTKAQRRIDGARVWTWVSRTSESGVTNLEQE